MTAHLLAAGAVGFVLGFRHAFEPDHMAAVTTLTTRHGSTRDAARLGLAWATGHTAAVGALALALIAFGLRVPPAFHEAAELLVAALLIVLGGSVLLRWGRGAHRHDVPTPRDTRSALAFGVAHGVAGSGAVAALLVLAATTRASQLAWFGAFGAGTIGGMVTISLAMALLVRRAKKGGHQWAPALHLATAGASVLIGVALAASVV